MIIYSGYLLIVFVGILVNYFGWKRSRDKWNFRIGAGVPAFLCAVLLWNVTDPEYLQADFIKSYYPSGRLVVENPAGLYTSQDDTRCFYFGNLPLLAYVFTPLAYMSVDQARYSFLFLGLLSLPVTVFLLFRLSEATPAGKAVLVGLIAVNGPLFYSIRMGNSTHFVLLLLALMFLAIKSGKHLSAGFAWGYIGLLKPPLFLLGLPLLLRKKWRILAGAAILVAAVTAVSVMVFGVDLHIEYCNECILPLADRPHTAFNAQSIDGFIARLMTGADATHWHPASLGPNFVFWRQVSAIFLLMTAVIILWPRGERVEPGLLMLELSIALCLSILISPISWTHYYLLLLLPLTLLLRFHNTTSRTLSRDVAVAGRFTLLPGQIFALIVAGVLLIGPPVMIRLALLQPTHPVLAALSSRILVSHYFLGGLILYLGFLLIRQRVAKEARA